MGGWGREGIAFCWGISITDASKPALKEKTVLLSRGYAPFYSFFTLPLDTAINRWAALGIIFLRSAKTEMLNVLFGQ